MNSSRAGVLSFAVLALMIVVIDRGTDSAWAQAGVPFAPGSSVDLETALQKGLRARRPVEFAFIARVAQMVDDGSLPQSVVISAFLWARRHRPYPYPYFALAMQTQYPALGDGIGVPQY